MCNLVFCIEGILIKSLFFFFFTEHNRTRMSMLRLWLIVLSTVPVDPVYQKKSHSGRHTQIFFFYGSQLRAANVFLFFLNPIVSCCHFVKIIKTKQQSLFFLTLKCHYILCCPVLRIEMVTYIFLCITFKNKSLFSIDLHHQSACIF